jgi:protein-tyrosine phosphatase
MIEKEKIAVLMVCMGNICRSPTAEAVLRHKLVQRGLADLVRVDSAGTHAWHTGEAPDHRSRTHAARRGYDLTGLRARLVHATDFDRFDLLLAMDEGNLAHLVAACPPAHRPKLRLLMDFAPKGSTREVPDPYGSGPEGFEQVLDLVESACEGLLPHLRQGKDAKNPA